jgi:hypothetical protein
MGHQNITLSFTSRKLPDDVKNIILKKICFILPAAIDASRNRIGFCADNT